MSTTKDFSLKLAEKIPGGRCSKSFSGVPLFFESTTLSAMFRDLFHIKDAKTFDEVFQISTGGIGNELKKINSVASSALLPLLVFHPLWVNSINNHFEIEIRGVKYCRVFFEIRNKVIRRPSCVDIVLQSKDEKKLLFMESKLTEYIDGVKKELLIGKGYAQVYEKDAVKNALTGAGLNEPKLAQDGILLSNEDNVYIEGIKQSLSHLIGIVRGPQKLIDEDSYPQSYYEKYMEAYNKADELCYATIIYNPDNIGEGLSEYKSYTELFRNVFSNGSDIIKAIKKIWPNDKNVSILQDAITYQEVFQNRVTYLDSLPLIKEFYRL